MNKKVLVVDDDASMRELLSAILGHLDYNVSFAENWNEALNLLKSNNFNILMTDFRMPTWKEGISNGIEFIRFIKSNNSNPRMKIILISDEIVEEDENDPIKKVALANGADVAVNKFEICNIDTMRTFLKNLWIYF